ncbi:pentatricopeptide repeat domain-containing protein 3, mitochondrial-like [Mya arenaria]|uniref:pentatricopeptide repeat domain-containing protein 3, mitochondrial-like n=1 Tax=Mya arenaria TaxID=6604 RepID=UPI0022E48BD9|nr:pentatricopeptide repeat domain-containing protein 3, mitochondrial-like [Mya arenaria]
MAASMGLRSNFIKIKNNFLLQRSCVLCHKLYSTETSPSGTDVRKGRLHRIKKEIPYEELGAVIQEEERAKIVAYYSRNVRVERTDVSAAAGKEAIAKNSTILVQGDGKTPVSLPKKKKRDSLSILKALASTVKVDPSAPHYSFIDDPGLIPNRNNQEACLLAKASGKRAARYFVNKHVKLFGNDDAVPHIQAFQPEKLDYVHTDVGEASLLERVDRREVADSVEVYDRMDEQGMTVSEEALTRLLELLCAYQCRDAENLYPEERLALANEDTGKRSLDKAVEVFEKLETRTADTYNWIIRALAEFDNTRCWTLWEEMKIEEFPAELATYNALIGSMRRDFQLMKNRKFEKIQDMLTEMNGAGLCPNLDTFHSVFRVMKTVLVKRGETDPLMNHLPGVIAEMKKLEIRPTLETWSLIFDTLTIKDPETDKWQNPTLGGKKVDLVTDISEIVDQLSEQRKEDRVLNHFGENFFTKAMSFLHRFNEVTVAIKVFDLKESMGARYVITDLQMENAFYEQFMFLLLKNKPLDVVMEYYTKCIRHGKLSSPSNSLRYTLYDAIYQYDAYQWIPIIYSDMSSIGFRMTFVRWQLLEMMAQEGLEQKFKQEFEKIADELHQVRKMREPMMTERMDDDIKTSHIIKIFLNNKNLQKAWDVVQWYTAQRAFWGYDLKEAVIMELLDKTIQYQDNENLMCLCEMEPNCRAMFKKHMNTLLTDREHELSAFLSKQRMDALRDIFLRD